MGFKLRPGTSLSGNVTFTPDEIPPKWLATSAYIEGEVYLYDMNNLSAQPITISSPDGSHYGRSISFAGDKLIVGSPLDDNPFDSGSFYVYDLNNISAQPIKIKPSDLESQDQYGLTMAANADKLFIS